MKKIFTILFVFITSYAFATAGDDCSTAILVSSSGCSATAAYNNTGIAGTLNTASVTCFTGGNNNGMWFSFIASSVNVSATVNGSTLTLPQLVVMQPPVGGCGGTFTELACSSPGTTSATVNVNGLLTVGNTYYVYVDGQNNNVGTFQLCLSSPQPPTNDDPCTAITPPSITNWCSPSGAYTTAGSTPGSIQPACFTPTSTANTVWFQFTPTQIGGVITINGSTGMRPQVALVTITGGCAGTSYANPFCAQAAVGQTSVTITDNFLVPGQTYYIVVSGVGGADGPFGICINNYAISSTVGNDQCSGAIPLCPGQRLYGTTAGATATNDIPISDWQCDGDLNNSVWYTFVPTSPPQNVTISMNWTDRLGTGAMQLDVFNFTGSGSPCAGASTASNWTSIINNILDPTCSNAISGPGSTTIPASSLVAGRTYYVAIDNFPGDTLDFDLTATGIGGTDAGPDVTICNNSAAFNLAGATPAGGTWSGPGVTNASAGTFNPIGLAPGIYTVYYTALGCSDSKRITIQGPTVTASSDVTICPGQSTTLTGNIVEYPGNGAVTFTNTNSYGITGGSNAQSVIGVSGINPNTVGTNPIVSVCVDITADYADDYRIQLICPGGTVLTMVPYNNSGDPFASNFTQLCFVTGATPVTVGVAPYTGTYAPSSPFSNLNGCVVDGNWTLKVTNNDIFDAGNINNWSITFNNTVPAPTYTWSPTTNMTNSTTLTPTVTPAATTTYTLTATDANGCTASDAVTVNVGASANGGPDRGLSCITLPGGSIAMGATASAGATWTAVAGNPGTSTITTPGSPTTTITNFSALGTYHYLWGTPGCGDPVDIVISATANAGPNQTVTCASLPGGTATMAAVGTGTWTYTGPGTATITTPTSPTTTVTNFSAPGVYTLTWTNGGCVASASVTVTAQPNAGPDKTVTCVTLPGGSATMGALTATGTWTAQAGNPGTAAITTPTSATTTITNYSAPGVYTFIWTNGTCSDMATVTVTAQPNAGANQTVTCAVLPGGSATMAATTATGTWTAQAGNPGTATITAPTSPTTTITNYSAAGVYTFIWTNGTCTSTATVTVSAQTGAGPNQTVTCATLPGGSATMAATGTGTWTAQAGNPGTATITTPTSPTTTITNYSVPGVYTFVWTNGTCTSTATVTVTAQPNAGANQTVTCVTLPGGSATMAATTATGTWTAQAGNPGTATITTPTSPTTTITNYSAAGVYTFIWTNGTCTSTATVTVTAQPNAGANKTVSCVALPGGSATMAATTATGTWTAQAGNPGTATITTPTSPTTTITTFSAAGVYTFIWTNGTCTSTATVTVSPQPNAGANQTVTCAVLPGGTATMAATTAIGTWTAQAGNPGTATITTPTSPTTTITTFSAAGVYTFVWTNGACSSTATVTVTSQPGAGPNQTVNCAVLPGGSATMAAVGTGAWTAQAGNPGTATITTPTSPTTTITTYSAPGVYTFVWANGTCTSTATVTVTAQPNAGANQTVPCAILPGGSATMAATTATGTWTAQAGNPGTATITTPTSPTTTITTFSAAGVYTFVWTNGTCTSTATVTVTAQTGAGPNQTVTCATLPGGLATMGATGTGIWTAQAGNPGTATITTPTSPTTTITTYSAPGVYTFVWTSGTCTSTATVTVTAQPNAGANQTVACATLPGGTATMAATTPTGTWTAQAGNPGTATITTPTSPTTTITTFSAAGVYTFVWTNGACSSTATVTVTAQPNAGANQTVNCATLPGGSATMAATTLTGTWTAQAGNPGTATITTPTSPTTTITTFSAAGVYTFVWTNGGCSSTATVTVTAQPNAGANKIVTCAVLPGGSATMAATTPTGTWTAQAGNPGTAVITTPTSPTTTITTFSAAGVYTFVWTNGTCTSTATVTVTAKPDAGPDQTVSCYPLNNSATMAAVGAGTWTALASNLGTATITTPNSPTTTITNYSGIGTYNFVWTSGGCIDTASVIITAKPNAGPDQTVNCVVLPGGSATMAAAGIGTWTALNTNPGTPTITNPNSPTTTITNYTVPGTYTFVWTVSTCTDTASVVVIPKPDAGADQPICQNASATAAAVGVGTWTAQINNPSGTTITTPSSPTTTITGFTSSGAYNFIWTVNGCPDTMTINVAATPDAGQDQTSCQYSFATMSASGSGTWSEQLGNPGTDVITTPTDPATTITGFSAPGVYTFIWTNADGCMDMATVTVTPKPNAGGDQNICQNAPATMAGVGIGVWSEASANPTAIITNPNQNNTTITGLTSIGIYSFVWTVNGCTDTVDIFVNPQPSVAVADDSACLGNTITLTAVPDMPGGNYQWSGGLGNAPSISVSPGATTPYTVTYTLGICSAQATGNAIVHALPVVNVGTANSICSANNGQAWAIATGNAPFSYAWGSPGGATDTITGLAPNSYSVVVTDQYGCTGTNSGTVGLSAPTIPVNLVSEHDLKCTGDNTGSITINAIDSGALIYAWTPPNNSSNTITNLAAGPYSVLVTDQFGCTGTGSYTVNEPTVLDLVMASSDPICPGSSTGTATGNPSGGSGAYHYDWNTIPAQHAAQAAGLPQGPYVLTVTDDSSCVVTGAVTLTDPAATTFGPGSVTDALCHGGSNGSATVDPQGGFGPYSYAWNDANHQSLATATGLVAGQYTVVVTDVRGCTVSTNVSIGEPTAFTVLTSHTDLTCYQNSSGTATATASGGTVPYRYVWSSGDSTALALNLAAATYIVTATDGLGCSVSTAETVNQPTSVLLTKSATGTTCAATIDGTITVVGSGGAGAPYTYSLKDVVGSTIQNNSTGLFQGLGAQDYTVVATDQNGCSASEPITVDRAAFNVYTASADSTSCYGDEYHDGRIHLGGGAIANAPFQYSVDNGPLQFIPDFYDLSAGVHNVRIVDGHNCDTTFTVIVGQPLPASVDILPGDSTIALGSSLQLSTAFRPYSTDSIKSYAWSPAEGLSCSDCPAPVASPYGVQNTYTVTVTYNQGCTAVTTVRVNVEGDPPVFMPSAFSPNGDGNNDVLYIYGEGIKTLKMTIFNRWGEKVFESDNQSQGWDGTYRGTLQEPGVYVYIVDLIYLNEHKRLKEGSITLIR